MASSSSALQVMGTAFTRPKVSQFSSSAQSFAKYQNELQNSFVTAYPNPMHPDSLKAFDKLIKDIASVENKIYELEQAKGRRGKKAEDVNILYDDLEELKAAKIGWEKDDLIFFCIMQHSLGGTASLIAFPQVSTFKLKEKPELPGALAYERLQKEYTQAKVHVLDKYSSEQSLHEFFVQPNLASPQIEIFLSEKISAHVAKYQCEDHVANDLYFKFSNIFLQNLPEGASYLALHVKSRTEFNEDDNKENGKELFLKIVKDAQAIYKALHEIQQQAIALKTSVLPSKFKLTAGKGKPKIPFVSSQQSAENSANGSKVCFNFNSKDGCRRGDSCSYQHKIVSQQVLETQRLKHSRPRVHASLAALSLDKTAIPSSSIKSNEFYSFLASSPLLLPSVSYLDTGASNTMSPHKGMFTDLVKSKLEIHVANDSIIYSTMVGIFHLPTILSDGSQITLHLKNSLYVPSLCATLISDRNLLALNYSILIEKGSQSLINGSKRIDLVRHDSGIISFPLPSQIESMLSTSIAQPHVASVIEKPIVQPNVVSIVEKSIVPSSDASTIPDTPIVPLQRKKTLSMNDLHLKHASFGHISIDSTISILRSENYSISEIQRKSFSCSHCALSKSKSLPAHSLGPCSLKSSTPKDIISVFHTDVAGPIPISSLNDDRYVISFRHEETNLLWTSCFKSMSDICNITKRFLTDMSNAILSVPIIPNHTVLLSDSAAVYLTPQMKQLLSNSGVISSASVPYHPKNNSISERGWRTLFTLARSMLSDAFSKSSFLSQAFWSYAVEHATLIINLTSLDHNNPSEKCSFEKILNKTPDIVLLKLLPFGCPVYAKIQTQRSKLEPTSFHAIVLGYDLSTQGYKIFNPQSGRITISVDVQPDLSLFYSMPLIVTSMPVVDKLLFEDDISEQQISKVNTAPTSSTGDQEEVPLSPNIHQHELPKCSLLDDFDDFTTPQNSSTSTPSKGFAFRAAPSSLSKALQGSDSIKWEAAIMKEYQSMIDNKVWVAVPDIGQRKMRSMFVLRIKDDDSFKVRIVACGSSQLAWIDYDPERISSCVLKATSMKLIFCKAIEKGYPVYHIDCVTAFLNSPAEFVTFMELPKLLVDTLKLPPLVQLLKGLYGTHDAPKLWYDLLLKV